MDKQLIYWVLGTFFATLTLVLVFLNFASTERKLEQNVARLYDSDDPQFKRAMGMLLGPAFAEGNRVETLLNGNEIFPAMLTAIRSAKQSITFETYIYWSGAVGQAFVDALTERARAGVSTHVLLDWVGSVKMEDKYLDALKKAGVEVERFHEPHWSHLHRMNNRTHRKLLVVDGRVGFTGGVGIADQWQGHASRPEEWRDTHYRVEGPVVAQMQAVFMDNWMKATGRVMHGPDYFPALSPAGDMSAQMFSSSPTGGSDSMHLMYLLAITAAKHRIDLASSYFVPEEMAIKALVAAAQRGVKVRVITPGPDIDSDTVRRASRARWGDLLEAGVEIAEYQPTMFHCKILVIDGLLASVGSTNFDNRSFRLNDEANLNVLNHDFAERQHADFEDDWKQSRKITLKAWRNRPWHEKLMEHTASLIGAQL